MTSTKTPEQMLRDLLTRDPGADLHDIRRRHPAFQAMSLDHLGLRLGRLLDREADARAK